MQINEFLNNVCSQIKYRPIRNEIVQELESHIKESKENYIESGMQDKEAEEKSILQMGNAEEIGKKLNKIHKPKFNLQLFILVLILLGFGFLVNYLDYTDKWKLNFITIILSVIPFVLIYFSDYRKLAKHSNLIYAIPTVILLHSIINEIWKPIGSIALPLYTIAFIGFIENINSESKIRIEFFEKHNININLVKIISLSILSIILLFEVPSISSAFILGLVYIIVSTIKLSQVKKKRKIAILWGIPIALSILIIAIYVGSPIGVFRLDRIIASFKPEIDPIGAGWQGMEQKAIINSANPFGKANYDGDSIKMFNRETYNFAFIAVLANYGWILSITMVIMVLAFNIKLIVDSRKIKDRYGKLLMLGIGCLFILRSSLCILMNLNLGIKSNFDIPFISYEKTSLIMDIMSLAIIFSIYRRKDITFNLLKESTEIQTD